MYLEHAFCTILGEFFWTIVSVNSYLTNLTDIAILPDYLPT